MPTFDGPDADSKGSGQATNSAGEVHSQLVEALVHVLIEKGVLTKNDALSIVQTVAEVKQGEVIESRMPAEDSQAVLRMLKRMYASFQALADHPAGRPGSLDNVRQLRPPLYGTPEFPRDD